MSTPEAKKLEKAEAKKLENLAKSFRTQCAKKLIDPKKVGELLLLPPPTPKVKKEPKETLAKSWVAHAYGKYASEYPAYLATLSIELQDAEKEKESKSGKMVKQNGLVANRNKINFAKKMETCHLLRHLPRITLMSNRHSQS